MTKGALHVFSDDPAGQRSKVMVWRAQEPSGAELLRGRYIGHVYPWHSHQDFSLGVVMEGAVSLETRRQSGVAEAGSLVAINSEEVHRGSAAGGRGWTCRTIHLHPATIHEVGAALAAPGASSPTQIRGPVVKDLQLASKLFDLHRNAEAPLSALDQQSRVTALIAQLLVRHGDTALVLPGWQEPEAVKKAREYLRTHLTEKVTLAHLSSRIGLPPFRLLRAFEKTTGLSLHAYQTQARVRMVHDLIYRNEPLAQVAVMTGFADQAHMTKVFKSVMGATPGQFRAAAK